MKGCRGEGIASGRLLCLSTFSGIGGLDLGLERAGFSVIGAIDNDAVARRSLALNRPRLRYLKPHDINEVARDLLPHHLGIGRKDLALLAAGPPCQPFSKAAQWSGTGARGMADSRADCLHGLMTLIERFLPRAILVENVTGFVRGASSALPFIEKGLAGVNNRSGTRYKLFYRVLNAVDFGIPQRRRRAFVIALRDGGEPVWPRVTHRDCPERAWDALQSVRLKTPPVSTGRFAALLPSIPEGQNYQYFTERGDGPALFGYRRRYRSFLLKLAKAEPAWTVPASPGPATGPFHWDSRPLAPEEILRLQAFPRAWKLEGSHRERVRQAGNATPPLLTEILGRSISTQVFGMDYRGQPPTLAIVRSARVPPPTPPRPVAAEYIALSGQHDPHPGAGRGPSPRPDRFAESQGEEERDSAFFGDKEPILE